MRRAIVVSLALGTATAVGSPALCQDGSSLVDEWRFGFRDFAIGAWWGPDATDAEMALYADCGFNIVMTGRYMQLDRYGDPDAAMAELDLAHRHGLKVMFDTYTMNDRPWGGLARDAYDHPNHHPADARELAWLHERIGEHPALVGYMIGDDQGTVVERSAGCTAFLRAQRPPRMIPWLCGWIQPADLAAHHNPYSDPQIYPTLYNWDATAEEHVRAYCQAYQGYSSECKANGVAFWPMLNTTHFTEGKQGKDMFGWCPSDSLVRFPIYAAIAYGAQGIWHFTYNGGALQHLGPHETVEKARAALTPLYPVVRKANRRVAVWGPRVLGTTWTGVFGTAFPSAAAAWPFEAPEAGPSPEGHAAPCTGKLVESMDDDLIVGVLVEAGKNPLAMVVDCRASKGYDDLEPRTVTVRFSPRVGRIAVLQGAASRTVSGSSVEIMLDAGEGQLLELGGRRLDPLCREESIYAADSAPAAIAGGRASDADLDGIRAAKLRIDVFGSEGGQYADKFVELNGETIGRVPAGSGDRWSLEVLDLTPEQLGTVRRANRVRIRTEVGDSWKFRNLTLAVQLSDGSWVSTPTDGTVHSVPAWAHSEGETWGDDGVAGPVELALP